MRIVLPILTLIVLLMLTMHYRIETNQLLHGNEADDRAQEALNRALFDMAQADASDELEPVTVVDVEH